MPPSAPLADILRCFASFPQQELDAGVARFRPSSVRRGQILLHQGEVCDAFYVVASGALRTYFLTGGGVERTRLILMPMTMGTSLASFVSGQPSEEFIDVLADGALFSIGRRAFFELTETSAPWKHFYVKILEASYLFQNRKIGERETLDAADRYKALLNRDPDLVASLSNAVVASYLGVAPETLSRIKTQF